MSSGARLSGDELCRSWRGRRERAWDLLNLNLVIEQDTPLLLENTCALFIDFFGEGIPASPTPIKARTIHKGDPWVASWVFLCPAPRTAYSVSVSASMSQTSDCGPGWVLSGKRVGLQNKGSQIRFLIKACTSVAD